MYRFNRSFSILVLAAMLVACAGQATVPTAAPSPPSPESAGKVDIKTDEITSQALAGNLLGDPATRNFLVLLPPSYSTTQKRYPVVYVLHWYTGGYTSMSTAIQMPYRTGLRNGSVQEMIFVFPDASNKLGGSQCLSSQTIGDYEAYITQELVDYVDANYRTIKDRNSRGITGCSMGGDGSMHLALKYPGLFSVAAPASGTYDWARDPLWEQGVQSFKKVPEDSADLALAPWEFKALLSEAAGAAPNPKMPPFYLDMPLTMLDGKVQIVSEVFDKIAAVDPVHDVDRYLAQPERLSEILIYHGENDPLVPVELARDFDKFLSDRAIDHEYLEVNAGHCDFDYEPVVKFMSDHLAAE